MNKSRYGQYVTHVEDSGQSYRIWEWNEVTRTNDRISNCIAYFYASRKDAEEGTVFGGSGFLIEVEEEDFRHIYAVTAAHVIKIGCTHIRVNDPTGDSKPVVFELNPSISYRDGDYSDFAVFPLPACPFVPDALPVDLLLSEEKRTLHNIGPGDEVYMAGRFNQFAGKTENLPVLRFGNIASPPVQVEIVPGQTKQCFLVEMRSISGFSGSPVFVRRTPMATDETLFLLGVDIANLSMRDSVLDHEGNPNKHGFFLNTNTGMATVVPAWKIFQILQSQQLKEQRATEREETRRRFEDSPFSVQTFESRRR